jgi:hypothetical protein
MYNGEKESEVKADETTETDKMGALFSFEYFQVQYLKNFFLFAVMGAGAGWVCVFIC